MFTHDQYDNLINSDQSKYWPRLRNISYSVIWWAKIFNYSILCSDIFGLQFWLSLTNCIHSSVQLSTALKYITPTNCYGVVRGERESWGVEVCKLIFLFFMLTVLILMYFYNFYIYYFKIFNSMPVLVDLSVWSSNFSDTLVNLRTISRIYQPDRIKKLDMLFWPLSHANSRFANRND